MAVWNTVNMHEIGNRVRIEAEFYRPEYVNCQKLVESVPHTRLGLCRHKITDGTHFTPRYTEAGVRFYSAVNIKDGYFAHEGPFKFISEAEHRAIHKRCPVQAGDVLLRKVGVGPRWSCVVPEGLEEFSIFVSVALIRTTGAILPEFLSTFINCRYGQLQLLRLNKGISQPDLHLEDIGELIVPLFQLEDQQLIAGYVRQSQAHRENSGVLYRKAQQLLEAELGLSKFTFQKPVGYIARLSEATASGRIDADHFQPQYATVRSLVKSYSGGYEPLLACCDSKKPNVDPTKMPKQVFRYIELSNIDSSIGVVEGAVTGCGNELPSRAKRQVKTGDVIASAVVGSIDKVAIITNEQDGFIASSGFFHLRPRTVSAEYLLMLVRSKCVQMQFQQQATGGILSAVPDSRLKHVLVPKLSDAVKEKITELVIQSHEAKRQSCNLLEHAKTRVEQLIEEAVKS